VTEFNNATTAGVKARSVSVEMPNFQSEKKMFNACERREELFVAPG
jgi:hypothetical protein